MPYFTVVLESEIESEAGDALGLGARGDFQTFDDTRIALVLQTRVFTLRILSDNCEIYICVAGGETGKGLAKNNRSVDVELLTHGDIPRDVAGLGNGGEEDTYPTLGLIEQQDTKYECTNP